MTNETFCRNKHIYFGFSIVGHILKDFMEVFQDWGISQLGISLVSSDLVFFSIN